MRPPQTGAGAPTIGAWPPRQTRRGALPQQRARFGGSG